MLWNAVDNRGAEMGNLVRDTMVRASYKSSQVSLVPKYDTETKMVVGLFAKLGPQDLNSLSSCLTSGLLFTRPACSR